MDVSGNVSVSCYLLQLLQSHRHFERVCSLDIIGFVAFGYDFGLGESQEAKAIIHTWAEQSKMTLLDLAFIAEASLRAFPGLLSLPFGAAESQTEIKRICDRLSQKLIKDAPEGGRKAEFHFNFLDFMMQASGDGIMTMHETIENLSTLVMAGYETTAATLTFILYELSRNQDCQQKL
ncbi:cytochrome P450 [Heliocybe sulcata]|uniref:Cytochrome P450 n=1 Tax=Heliocybe sulcata TaxID=5364 RepID=A0A5C3N0Q1_9AGAM|nr:cytochrome P450 [Heliocybe sulcata]